MNFELQLEIDALDADVREADQECARIWCDMYVLGLLLVGLTHFIDYSDTQKSAKEFIGSQSLVDMKELANLTVYDPMQEFTEEERSSYWRDPELVADAGRNLADALNISDKVIEFLNNCMVYFFDGSVQEIRRRMDITNVLNLNYDKENVASFLAFHLYALAGHVEIYKAYGARAVRLSIPDMTPFLRVG